MGQIFEKLKTLKAKQHDSSFTYESALRGEKRKSSSASMDNDNWRRKLQESENKFLEAKKERNETVACLEKELLVKAEVLDGKDDTISEVCEL